MKIQYFLISKVKNSTTRPEPLLDLYPADTHGVEGVGNDGQSPKINGLLIGTNEFARAVAIAPGRQRLVLGSGSSLRAYDVPSQVPPARPGWHRDLLQASDRRGSAESWPQRPAGCADYLDFVRKSRARGRAEEK